MSFPREPSRERGSRPLPQSVPATFARLLNPSAVPFYVLRTTHMPHLRMERGLTGSAQNVDTLLAIHPPALDAYHHLMPSMLRVTQNPGTAPYLAMHFAARGANAPYAAAFSAVIALRNHVAAHTLRLNHFSDREAVVVDFALRMGTVPSALTQLSANSIANVLYGNVFAVEAVVLAVAFGGLVARLTHLLSPDFEAAIVRPVQFLEAVGWSLGAGNIVANPADPLQELPQSVVRTDHDPRDSGGAGPGMGGCAISRVSLVGAEGDPNAAPGGLAGMAFARGMSSGSASGAAQNVATAAAACVTGMTSPLTQGSTSSGAPTSSSPTSPSSSVFNAMSPSASGPDGPGTRPTFFSNRKDAHALRRFDARRLKLVPEDSSSMCQWLAADVGHSFPILAHIRHAHPRRALALAIRDALAPSTAVIPMRAKFLSALAFANTVSNRPLADEFASLCASSSFKQATPHSTIAAVENFARSRLPTALVYDPNTVAQEIDPTVAVPDLASCSDLSDRDVMLLILVRTTTEAWTSDVEFEDPAVSRAVIDGIGKFFKHNEIVDIVWWLSLVQCLHHINQFFLLESGHRCAPANKEKPVPFMGQMGRRARAAYDVEPSEVAGGGDAASRGPVSGGPELDTKRSSVRASAAGLAYDDHLNATSVQTRRGLVSPTGGPATHGGKGKLSGFSSALRGLSPAADKEVLSMHNFNKDVPHPETIAAMLIHHRVSFAQLKVKHYAMLKLEKLMIGAAPNTDTYLAIYPTGFRTSMLIIPNLLNIPQLMLGNSTASSVIGVAMHYSSRASKSRYCSLHTACFAMRRGIPAAVLRLNAFNEGQAVAVDAALRLATFPSTMTRDCRDLLYQVHSLDDVEWIVMAIAMMGFLQKFVDTCGCQLEQASYDQAGDFLTSLGWGPGKHLIAAPVDKLQELGRRHTDNVWTNLTATPYVPAVMLWDRKVTARVPSTYPAAGNWLLKKIGYHFPILGHFRNPRVIRTLCTVLRDNLEPSQCNVTPSTKLLCGMVYATKAENPAMVADLRRCALHLGPHLLPGTCDLVIQFALEDIDFGAPTITLSDTMLREAGADLTLSDRRALLLAKAGSTSPSTITPVVLGGMEELFSAPAMIEQLVWLGVCQMLHRLYIFYMDENIAPPPPTGPNAAASGRGADAFFLRNEDDVRGDDRVAGDETRRSPTGSNSATPKLPPRPSNIAVEDYAKGSVVRQEGPGGRLVLKGAEPIFIDETERHGPETGIYDVGSARPVAPHTNKLFVPMNYIERDVSVQTPTGIAGPAFDSLDASSPRDAPIGPPRRADRVVASPRPGSSSSPSSPRTTPRGTLVQGGVLYEVGRGDKSGS